ncbi:MAG: hypothetical protein ACRDD2_13695 [Sarcina sp.]
MLRVYLLSKGMEHKKRESQILENNIRERVEFKRARKYTMQIKKMLDDLQKLNDKVIDDEMIEVLEEAAKIIKSRQ